LEADPFENIDYYSYFDQYLDPGFKSPAPVSFEKPSFETFVSSPSTLSAHLNSQLNRLRDQVYSSLSQLAQEITGTRWLPS
jgi:RNA polymerase sigma-54 factor